MGKMTVEQFAAQLKAIKDRALTVAKKEPGQNNRSYLKKSVRLSMQRRRTP